jgi:hypothetical protein
MCFIPTRAYGVKKNDLLRIGPSYRIRVKRLEPPG